MHPADIKAALEKKGLTQKQIAKDLKVHPNSVSRVVRQEAVSDRIMKYISAAIDKHPTEVFPEYYLSPPKRRNSKRAGL